MQKNSWAKVVFKQKISLARNWMVQKALIDWGDNKVYEQHEKIIADLEAGDAAKAEKALKAHLMSTGEKLIAAILAPRVRDHFA